MNNFRNYFNAAAKAFGAASGGKGPGMPPGSGSAAAAVTILGEYVLNLLNHFYRCLFK